MRLLYKRQSSVKNPLSHAADLCSCRSDGPDYNRSDTRQLCLSLVLTVAQWHQWGVRCLDSGSVAPMGCPVPSLRLQ